MIEGYTLADWKQLPVGERAGLFGEKLYEYGERNLPDVESRVWLDRMNSLTVDIYTGRLNEEERVVAQAEIDEIRQQMFDHPDREVGRVAFEYGWIGALFFGNEIKNGIPERHPVEEPSRSSTAYKVVRTYDRKTGRSYKLVPLP